MQRALTVARNMDFLVTALGTPASLDSISIWNNNWHSIFPNYASRKILLVIYTVALTTKTAIYSISRMTKSLDYH